PVARGRRARPDGGRLGPRIVRNGRLPGGGHRLHREAKARVRRRATASEPFLRVPWTDPVTTRHAYLVIDRLVGGISGGGTRVREGCTLEEVERLAQTMTL